MCKVEKFFSILFLLLFLTSTSYALENSTIQQSKLAIADRQLEIDKITYDLAKKQFSDLKNAKQQQYQLLNEKGITHNILKHSQLDFIAAQAAVEGANIALTDAKQSIDDTESTLRNVEKNLQILILLNKGYKQLDEDRIISVEAHLEILKKLQQVQNERVQVLNDIKAITLQRLTLENNWQQQIQTLYLVQQQDHQRSHLSESLFNLQQEQQLWLAKLNNLTQSLQQLTQQGQVSDASLRKLQLQILEAEENVALIRLKSYLLHVQNRAENLEEFHKNPQTTTSLNDLIDQVVNIINQLSSANEFVHSKIKFLSLKKNQLASELSKDSISPLDVNSYSTMLSELISNYEQETVITNQLVHKAALYQHELKLQLQHHLSMRQVFPSDFNGWIVLSQKMLQIPDLLVNVFKNYMRQTVTELQRLDTMYLNLGIVGIILLVGIWFCLRRYLLNLEINIKEDKQRFSTNVVYIVLEMIRRNLGGVFVFGALLSITMAVNISAPIFIYLFLVYLCYKILLSIAKLTLLENVNDISGKDVKLYYRIRWSLLLGLLLSSLTVIAHQMPVAYEAKALANRLFMVFIFVIAIQLFKARTYIPNLLETLIHIPKRYFYHVLKILSILIPLALLFNAVFGLLGFVELAWTVGKYQILFILVLAGYLIARGLLIDSLELLSEFLIRYVKQGWLWTEAILKPIDRILRMVLLLLSALFLLHLYRLDNNELFINSVHQFLKTRLFSIGGNIINPLLLLELLITLSLIKWLAHWSREFSYRWLYVNSKDVGVRNSLSIFTQYASVIISVLVGLKLLGIDLHGFTVVAAAFAAGIGFGMRDLIVNFFSGILLLIERPFRTGDIITLGNHEGEVILTGIRSMTIRTWDHMEVIVPNADMFTKPFVNWTHHDNIVRTVITLKIHREDDPYKVQHLILNILKHHPSVANEPLSEVIMSEISDSLIEMQVRYYVLLIPQRTRTGVRSEVLFAIWDCFKQHNIRAPHPQYDLIVKNQSAASLV